MIKFMKIICEKTKNKQLNKNGYLLFIFNKYYFSFKTMEHTGIISIII